MLPTPRFQAVVYMTVEAMHDQLGREHCFKELYAYFKRRAPELPLDKANTVIRPMKHDWVEVILWYA